METKGNEKFYLTNAYDGAQYDIRHPAGYRESQDFIVNLSNDYISENGTQIDGIDLRYEKIDDLTVKIGGLSSIDGVVNDRNVTSTGDNNFTATYIDSNNSILKVNFHFESPNIAKVHTASITHNGLTTNEPLAFEDNATGLGIKDINITEKSVIKQNLFFVDSTTFRPDHRRNHGQYFNFNLDSMKRALNKEVLDPVTLFVSKNYRTNKVGEVIIWNNPSAGRENIVEGHGRNNPYSRIGVDDWKAGDAVEILYNTFMVSSVYHPYAYNGKYFNFDTRAMEFALGRNIVYNEKILVKNERTGKEAEVVIWNQSSHNVTFQGHGRYVNNPQAGDWNQYDIIKIIPTN